MNSLILEHLNAALRLARDDGDRNTAALIQAALDSALAGNIIPTRIYLASSRYFHNNSKPTSAYGMIVPVGDKLNEYWGLQTCSSSPAMEAWALQRILEPLVDNSLPRRLIVITPSRNLNTKLEQAIDHAVSLQEGKSRKKWALQDLWVDVAKLWKASSTSRRHAITTPTNNVDRKLCRRAKQLARLKASTHHNLKAPFTDGREMELPVD